MIRHRQGFSLIESMIYIAILATMVISFIAFLQIAVNTYARSKSTILLTEEFQFILARIEARARRSEEILDPAVGSSSSTLTLHLADPEINPTLFFLRDGSLFIREGASSSLRLTTESIWLDGLLFTHVNGSPDQARMTLRGRIRNGLYPYSATLSVTGTIPLTY